MGLLQRLEAQRDSLKAEGKELRAAAEEEGSYSDEARARRDEIIASLDRLESDIKAELDMQQVLLTAPADPEPVATAPPVGAPTPFRSLGEQMQSIYKAATQQHSPLDTRLITVNDWGARQAAATGAGETVGSDGGFLVQQDFSADLMLRVFNSGALASRCQTIPIGAGFNGVKVPMVDESSRADGSRFGAVRAYWLDEGSAITASRPKFQMVDLTLKRLGGLLAATDELIQDTTAYSAIAEQAFTAELAFALDDAIFRGTGAGRPQGILNADATVSQAKETGQSAATVLAENIDKMWARLWSGSRANAVWFINQEVLPQLDQLEQPVGTGGVPLFRRPDGIIDAPAGTLKGRPIVEIEHASALGTVGDIVLADLSQYYLARKGGVERASSIHLYFDQAEQAFRWIVRVNGILSWTSALTPYKGSNTQSPVITLATRS